MARHLWSIICRYTLAETSGQGIFSLIDVMDGMSVRRSTPTEDLKTATSVNFKCKLVSLWIRSQRDQPEKAVARIGLVLPNGEKAHYSDPLSIDMDSHPRMRSFVNLEVLPLKGPGTYEFLVELQLAEHSWQEVARVPLEVDFDEEGLP